MRATHALSRQEAGREDREDGRRMVSLRLTAEARAILRDLARAGGVSQSAVLETLLREAASR